MPGTANYFTLYRFRIEERKHRSIRSHEEGERKKNIDNMELCSIWAGFFSINNRKRNLTNRKVLFIKKIYGNGYWFCVAGEHSHLGGWRCGFPLPEGSTCVVGKFLTHADADISWTWKRFTLDMKAWNPYTAKRFKCMVLLHIESERKRTGQNRQSSKLKNGLWVLPFSQKRCGM